MGDSKSIKVHGKALDRFMQATSCAEIFLDKYEKDPDNLTSNDILILFYALECLRQQLRDGCKSTMIRNEAEALYARLEAIVSLLQVIDWDNIRYRTDTKTSWKYAARVFGKSFEEAKQSRNDVKHTLFWKRFAKSLAVGGIGMVSLLPTASIIAMGIGAACFGGITYIFLRADDESHLHRIGLIYPYCIYNTSGIGSYMMTGCPQEKQLKEDMEYIRCTGVKELNSENYRDVLTVNDRMQ